ncbi:shikimate 5-dehydrogenase [Hafnia paralvei]|uniref:shikimate 5-dehydrogenase n=1 Tax=Hafnia paralvei TaxID=546367 RepID=UPI000BB533C1|nr:shikimate 5-dehydrogenase [Hafnia paralvei]MBW2957154.1 shikimate 5-dehydrogenase [Hafnia paralvei]MCE9902433.1 shikimate 5-dehydrogenase [Hafnia paralvei]MCE9918869.1 shikimate 5-dehydrogenase [Hafnia paralvei]MCE9947151.1 shikimate 5-dehydrogenase [Hafnia paralvei]MCQ4169220.1 shikimate 5-dehydrogenase [Hafnia paralvei]
MTKYLNKDTQVCMSLAARPSNFGTRFHNYLYDALDLDYLYKAFTTKDIQAAIGGVRALGIRGCAISMPFKEDVIPLVDEMDASAKAIDSVNTIVNTDGHLKAYNTDYLAIAQLLAQYAVSNDQVFALRGSGGMAKAVACALKDAGFKRGYIVAKNEKTGQQLAALYGYEWRADMQGVTAEVLINATPIGMSGGADADKLAYSEDEINSANVVFDVVALPSETPMIRYAKTQGKTVISGAEVFAIQAVEQFVLYTGIRPDHELFLAAAQYARESA